MPPLRTLKIEHYKGFFEEETLEFAIPDGKTPGSGLTLIVGPNNAGKTTLLEALLLEKTDEEAFDKVKRFSKSERHLNFKPRITINKCVYSNIDQGSEIEIVDQSKPHGIDFEIVQSRRHWSHRSDISIGGRRFLESTREVKIRGPESPMDIAAAHTAAALKGINKDKSRKSKLNELMKQIIPHFTDWAIDTDDGGDYVTYRTENSEHQANLLGEGVMSAFRICIHLVSGEDKDVLIIDEPELSLHPIAQKSLSLILSEKSKNKQIILCTHSPYFVNLKDFVDGAHFIRLNKVKDKKCTVSRLRRDQDYSSFISRNLYEWQRPQLLDTVAKEVLFSNKVLFVEGQEDVGLIRRWAVGEGKSLDFDIFGYGVGGYANIRLFLQMAQDLGIEKVGALYDSGTDANKFFNEDKSTPFLIFGFRNCPRMILEINF